MKEKTSAAREFERNIDVRETRFKEMRQREMKYAKK